MIIQYVLIALMFGVLAYFLSRRNSMQVRAWKRILLGAFILIGMVAVMLPDLANRAANMVGIGRGADLLLYLTVVAFVFVSLNVYLKFKDLDNRLAVLARAIALHEADLERLSAQAESAGPDLDPPGPSVTTHSQDTPRSEG